MPTLIPAPKVIPVPGNKEIREYVGRVNTKTEALSVAHMVSPPGWSEPGQTPEFAEYTVVLRGVMRVEPGPFQNHSDDELILLESLVGRKPPFMKDGRYPLNKY